MVFTIRADRFLRNMVRAIVGTMLDLGFGKIDLEVFRQIIESRDRSHAGTSAPARGLFLADVQYPPDIFL
jgi:tRNA pseudouridine38-40 synthase